MTRPQNLPQALENAQNELGNGKAGTSARPTFLREPSQAAKGRGCGGDPARSVDRLGKPAASA